MNTSALVNNQDGSVFVGDPSSAIRDEIKMSALEGRDPDTDAVYKSVFFNGGKDIDPFDSLGSAKIAADYENKLFLENDSTKFQRAYKDLVETGLNPRLLLSHGFDTSSGSTSVPYNVSSSSSTSKSESFSSSALLGLLLAAVIKAIF